MMIAHAKRRRGRPPKRGIKHDSLHRPRPPLDTRTPVHVVMRCTVKRLRQNSVYRGLRGVVAKYFGREDFHITHMSIQTNHLHLIVEATDRMRLARGMQSFGIRAARAIHKALSIRGKVFAFRYHATQITSLHQARRTIAYVLNNWRKHEQDRVSPIARSYSVDPYSSGSTFTRWTRGFKPPPHNAPLQMTPPRTDWLRSWPGMGGLLIDPWEVPSRVF